LKQFTYGQYIIPNYESLKYIIINKLSIWVIMANSDQTLWELCSMFKLLYNQFNIIYIIVKLEGIVINIKL
jgi:hypothetical protein